MSNSDYVYELDTGSLDESFYNDDVFSDDSVRMYLEEIGRIPVLDKMEEKSLFERVRCGDGDAKKRLIEANLRLVVHFAKDYYSDSASFLDVVQYGNFGLISAIEKYDASKGFAFSTFAAHLIKNSIVNSIGRNENGIAMSAGLSRLIKKYDRKCLEYYTMHGVYPDDEEIADILDVSVSQIKKLKKYQLVEGNRYLDLTMKSSDDEDDGYTLLSFVVSPDLSVEDATLKTDSRELVEELLSSLNDKEKAVLKLRYSNGFSRPLTFSKVGEALGVSREIRALKKMGNYVMNNERFADYVPSDYKGFDIFSRKVKCK